MIARRIALMVVALSFAAPIVQAGELFGKVVEGTSSVGEGASLEVKCGGKSYAAKTDKSGSYRVVVAETGKCSMTVTYKGQSGSVEFASYDDPVQVDLVVEVKDGKLSVRRK